jgi:proteasome assembly chaperone (PAC2) family protein
MAEVPGSEALQIDELPELHEPLLVCAFAGWNDAGQSATGAVRYLVEHLYASRFARIDPEEFYVFTEVRPTVHMVDGARELDWPSNDFHFVQRDRFGHDLVLMPGIEPNMHWREYTGLVLDLARRIDARMVITLGGLLAGVAHTAPVPVTGSSTNPEILANWVETGVRRSRYEGPTGIVGVLGDACRRVGLPNASIWANVPHYLSVSPNPKTVAALVHRVNNLLELDLDLHELDRATERFERQVEEAVSRDPDVQRYVRQLEQSSDDEEEDASAELPSGAALVQDLEEFLRRQREEDEDDEE